MTHFKDYLRDIHQADKSVMDIDFEDWLTDLESQADLLGIYFKEYLSKIEEPRKLGKVAYIVLNNQ